MLSFKKSKQRRVKKNKMSETVINTIITVIITSIISGAASGITVYAKSVKKKTDALENGMLSLLRAEIIRQHDKYTSRQYCPIYAKDALNKAYDAYHSLGGNGTITKIYNETMALPEEPKEDKK